MCVLLTERPPVHTMLCPRTLQGVGVLRSGNQPLLTVWVQMALGVWCCYVALAVGAWLLAGITLRNLAGISVPEADRFDACWYAFFECVLSVISFVTWRIRRLCFWPQGLPAGLCVGKIMFPGPTTLLCGILCGCAHGVLALVAACTMKMGVVLAALPSMIVLLVGLLCMCCGNVALTVGAWLLPDLTQWYSLGLSIAEDHGVVVWECALSAVVLHAVFAVSRRMRWSRPWPRGVAVGLCVSKMMLPGPTGQVCALIWACAKHMAVCVISLAGVVLFCVPPPQSRRRRRLRRTCSMKSFLLKSYLSAVVSLLPFLTYGSPLERCQPTAVFHSSILLLSAVEAIPTTRGPRATPFNGFRTKHKGTRARRVFNRRLLRMRGLPRQQRPGRGSGSTSRGRGRGEATRGSGELPWVVRAACGKANARSASECWICHTVNFGRKRSSGMGVGCHQLALGLICRGFADMLVVRTNRTCKLCRGDSRTYTPETVPYVLLTK